MIRSIFHQIHLGLLTIIYFLLLLILIETGLQFTGHSVANDETKVGRDRRVDADAYTLAGIPKEEIEKLYEEFVKAWGMRWEPYVYWRRKAVSGQYVNIDKNGIRTTWNPVSVSANKDKCEIFFFGGSAAWGTGVSDEETIPSHLSKILSERGINCRLINFGESGFVLMQEIITLQQQLRSGRVPRLVIFYDGVNDVYSAFQNPKVGVPLNEGNREMEFNIKKRINTPEFRQEIVYSFIDDILKKCLVLKYLKHLGASFHLGDSVDLSKQIPEVEYDLNQDIEERNLTKPQEVFINYTRSLRLIAALGKEYNFTSVAYIQPAIFFKSTLTKWEQEYLDKRLDVRQIFLKSYDLFQKGFAQKTFPVKGQYLGNLFQDRKEPVFLDAWHISSAGNRLIAETMLDTVLSELHRTKNSGANQIQEQAGG